MLLLLIIQSTSLFLLIIGIMVTIVIGLIIYLHRMKIQKKRSLIFLIKEQDRLQKFLDHTREEKDILFEHLRIQSNYKRTSSDDSFNNST